jgi:hypothetical protein
MLVRGEELLLLLLVGVEPPCTLLLLLLLLAMVLPDKFPRLRFPLSAKEVMDEKKGDCC